MGLTALLPLRRKLCSGFLSPLKIHRPRSGSNPRTLGSTTNIGGILKSLNFTWWLQFDVFADFKCLRIKKVKLLTFLTFLLRCRDQSIMSCFLEFRHHILFQTNNGAYTRNSFFILSKGILFQKALISKIYFFSLD
jgi:hypothetical protein